MHNLVSHNGTKSWKWDEKSTVDEKYDQVSDYFSVSRNVVLSTMTGGSRALSTEE